MIVNWWDALNVRSNISLNNHFTICTQRNSPHPHPLSCGGRGGKGVEREALERNNKENGMPFNRSAVVVYKNISVIPVAAMRK